MWRRYFFCKPIGSSRNVTKVYINQLKDPKEAIVKFASIECKVVFIDSKFPHNYKA